MAKKIEVPIGVKIIAILNYIGAVFGVIFGILFIAGAGFVSTILESSNALASISEIAGAVIIVLGIVFIAFGVLEFFIGRGLWKAQNWARVLSIIFAVLGLLMSLIAIFVGEFMSILWLIIYGAIGWYLWFSKEVKKAFSR